MAVSASFPVLFFESSEHVAKHLVYWYLSLDVSVIVKRGAAVHVELKSSGQFER